MSVFEVILVRIFPAFSRIRTEYGKIRSISPYSVQMWENGDQNYSEYGPFLRSDLLLMPSIIKVIKLLLVMRARSATAERSFSTMGRMKTWNKHCVKNVQLRSFFWSEYRKIWARKNSIFVFGHFSLCKKIFNSLAILNFHKSIHNCWNQLCGSMKYSFLWKNKIQINSSFNFRQCRGPPVSKTFCSVKHGSTFLAATPCPPLHFKNQGVGPATRK